jgi:hypothetical protein
MISSLLPTTGLLVQVMWSSGVGEQSIFAASHYFMFLSLCTFLNSSFSMLLRHSRRAVSLFHSSQDSTDYGIIHLEDFLHTLLFPDLLPQSVGGFSNNILRELLLRNETKLRCLHNVFFNRFLSAQEENVQLREEVEGLHRKFDALKRFAAQKKIRLPAEFEQYQ